MKNKYHVSLWQISCCCMLVLTSAGCSLTTVISVCNRNTDTVYVKTVYDGRTLLDWTAIERGKCVQMQHIAGDLAVSNDTNMIKWYRNISVVELSATDYVTLSSKWNGQNKQTLYLVLESDGALYLAESKDPKTKASKQLGRYPIQAISEQRQ